MNICGFLRHSGGQAQRGNFISFVFLLAHASIIYMDVVYAASAGRHTGMY